MVVVVVVCNHLITRLKHLNTNGYNCFVRWCKWVYCVQIKSIWRILRINWNDFFFVWLFRFFHFDFTFLQAWQAAAAICSPDSPISTPRHSKYVCPIQCMVIAFVLLAVWLQVIRFVYGSPSERGSENECICLFGLSKCFFLLLFLVLCVCFSCCCCSSLRLFTLIRTLSGAFSVQLKTEKLVYCKCSPN